MTSSVPPTQCWPARVARASASVVSSSARQLSRTAACCSTCAKLRAAASATASSRSVATAVRRAAKGAQQAAKVSTPATAAAPAAAEAEAWLGNGIGRLALGSSPSPPLGRMEWGAWSASFRSRSRARSKI